MLGINFKLGGGQHRVGVCFVSKENRVIRIVEFDDNQYYSNLESIVIQMNNEGGDEETKVEALVNMPNIESDSSRIHDIFAQLDINLVVGNRTDFTSKDFETYLEALLSNKYNWKDFLHDNELALNSFSALVRQLQLYSNNEYHGKFDLTFYRMNDYVRLDVAAIKALSILPQNSGSNQINLNYEATSIYEIINYTKTSIGKRLLKRWIKQPIRDEEEINRRLDIVEYFVENEECRNSLYNDHLKSFPDIERDYIYSFIK